ncbi:BTB/POZ domain-containing protein [Camellia lanceoleosa]|uniref:BTB/POZ domain-containing protein n=1 Tax=Camellia lanceoleosa TaxID=1840588 RepID=A0ACC0GKX7_9ERIC|nr:BTB/POZ domain-containing protein [Camellia lanceoleosa]
MKFMKLGTRPDTFYTEEATRMVISDVASDLIIQINKINYLLHKYQLLPKCGLLRLCSDSEDSASITLELHDIPGGEDAFELCAKFCYGIEINLSARNIVPAICAAKFLRMTEAVERGNFILKLESFFNSCILEGWKDSILTLQTTGKLPEWSENLGIIRRCIDSVVEKILTPLPKVTWSYTYTRPGYSQKRHQIVPKDWWTEDVSDLDIDLFRCIITTIRSTNMLPQQLIGEALHVYACRWLPDTTKNWPPESSTSQIEDVNKKQRILDTVASMIPADRGCVSIGFLLRLLSIANFIGASPVTKAELIRRSCMQLEEATVNDLLFPPHLSSNSHFYDVDLVGAVLESFLQQWRRQNLGEQGQSVSLIQKVGKLIDSYLQVVSRDVNLPVQKVVSIEHPDLEKVEKKHLCRILDCQKLSPEVCAHAVKNERLPLRTVVQVLFFEQERGARSTTHKLPPQQLLIGRQRRPITANDSSKSKVSSDGQSYEVEGITRTTNPGITESIHHKTTKSDGKLVLEPEQNVTRKKDEQTEIEKARVIKEEGTSGCKFDPSMIIQRRTKSDRSHSKASNTSNTLAEKYEYQAEVSRLMDLIVNSLYSNKEVFLLELISNASDALDKLRFLSVTDPNLLKDGVDLDIRIQTNKDNGIITITDSGIGMTRQEPVDCLGTIAQSGTAKFLKALKVHQYLA